MGGQQSARRITIENDEPNNVIKVSEKVVERLKGSVEKDEKPNSQVPPRSMPSSTVHIEPRKLASDYKNDELTSLDIKKQYEDEIQKNNEYWENRIKGLQESYDKMQAIWDQEYKKAIEEVESSFPSNKGDKKEPCSDQKGAVLQCYKKNSNQPLLCANEVKAFSDCMNGVTVNSKKD